MNTRFSYPYRDACNHKIFNDVVLAGIVKESHIKPFLKDQLFFISSEIGFSDLQDDVFSVDVHIWHEFEKIELTKAPTNIDLEATLLINNFQKAFRHNWDEYAVFKRKGLL